MSNYTVPSTQTDDVLITTSIWNTQVVENLKALQNGPTIQYPANEGSDYTTTSTSFTNVDASPVNASFSLQLTLDTTSDVMMGFQGTISGNINNLRIYFDVTQDGNRLGGDDGMVAYFNGDASNRPNVPLTWMTTGVASGLHTFNLQWKVGGSTPTAILFAGAGTSTLDVHPQFWVMKI